MKTIAEKVKKLELENRSFMSVYKYELESKRDVILSKFSLNHSEQEIECKRIALDLDIKNKLKKKEQELSHKVSKYKIDSEEKILKNKNRIWEVDLARGLVIIGMIIDHFIGDFWMVFPEIIKDYQSNAFFKAMYEFSNTYWGHPVRVTMRLVGLVVLLLVSGISSKFSRNNVKRCALIIGFGLLIDVGFAIYASVFNAPADYVIIGAVLCIGICLAIYCFFRWVFYKFDKNMWKWVSLGLAIGILASWGLVSYYNAVDKSNFWFYYNNYAGVIPCIWNINKVTGGNLFRVITGMTYYGSDWLGLFPYLGYMFLGGFLGEVLYAKNKPINTNFNYKANKVCAPITFFGRQTLWFYVLHQPVIIALVVIVALCMGCQIGI